MRLLFSFCCLLFFFTNSGPAWGEGNWYSHLKLGASLGYVAVDKKGGANLGLGVALTGKGFSLRANPVDLNVFGGGPEEGYREETTSDGREICRDVDTGQFAEEEHCQTTQVDYGVSLDMTYTLIDEKASLAVGGGKRFSFGQTVTGDSPLYALAQIHFKNPLFVEARIQNDYQQISLGVGF